MRGRSTVLTVNYRNTVQVTAAAMAVMAGHEFDDLEEAPVSGERRPIPLRQGERPLVMAFGDPELEAGWIVEEIRRRVASGEVELGDIGVFLPTNVAVSELIARLRASGLPAQNLQQYKGRTTRAVKVGTYFRLVITYSGQPSEFLAPLLGGGELVEHRRGA